MAHEEPFCEYVELSSEQEFSSDCEEQHKDDTVDSTVDLLSNPTTLAQNYNIEQNQSWEKKEKVELDVTFDLTQGPVMDHFAGCSNEGDFFLKFIDSEIRDKII